ncbi:hypothetical protein FCN51_13230 [Acetobacter pasteurianus]|nr:hypothetical protein [Acetobacter pasteurianus]WKC16483.1 hypothetical protein FCN51_13230 [Acetobacter pasteurianus]
MLSYGINLLMQGQFTINTITNISRLAFCVASIFLIILATLLIVSGTIGLVSAFIVSLDDGREEIVQAISYVVIAVAVFDIAKYFIEEEVLRPKEKQSLSEARVSLTKFMTTIIIAVFIEGLVGVFERSGKAPEDILFPAALLIVATFMVIALGVYQKFSVSAEGEKKKKISLNNFYKIFSNKTKVPYHSIQN